MQKKISYSDSHANKTHLWLKEHRLKSSKKKKKFKMQLPSPTDKLQHLFKCGHRKLLQVLNSYLIHVFHCNLKIPSNQHCKRVYNMKIMEKCEFWHSLSIPKNRISI
jgi:hypothetical protein